VVLTVLSSFLRQYCLVFTNVTSALEVFFSNVMRNINPRFTYLLTCLFCMINAATKFNRNSRMHKFIALDINRKWRREDNV